MSKAAFLISGAAKRIGRHIASHFAHRGHPVAIHYRTSAETAEAFAASLRRDGCNARAVGADLANAEATQHLITRASEALEQPIQILVNNASLFEDDRMGTLNAAGFDAHMAINTRAPLLLSQALAGQVGPPGGLIVNIIDQRVWRLNPAFISYTASKAALWALTQTTAQALAPQIRVNAIGPGPTLANDFQDDGVFEAEAAAVPLQRGPALDEISTAIKFFMDTPSVTGQMIALDGGQHLAWQTPDFEFGGA